MKKTINAIVIALFILGIIITGCSKNNQTSPQETPFARNPGERMGFNPEQMQEMQENAKAACQGKAEGDACETESPRGALQGKCSLFNGELSCRPEGMNRGPGNGEMFQQMQEKAVAACQEKTEGAECTMQSPRGEMQGTCKTQEEKLMCTPEFEGRPPMQ